MARIFGGMMAAVLVICIVLSQLIVDPNCTEGPCSQDIPMYVALAVDTMLGLLWLILAFAEEVDRTRDRDQDR
jgi:hypothetical protein